MRTKQQFGRKILGLSWAVLAASLLPASTEAGHGPLGERIVKRVSLKLVPDDDSPCPSVLATNVGMREVFPDGMVSDEIFAVPAGHKLVMTDLAWTVSPKPSDRFLGGRSLNISVNAFDGTTPRPIFSAVPRLVESDTFVPLGGREMLQAGVELGEGLSLCVSSFVVTESGGGFVKETQSLRVNGYLVRNRWAF